MQGQVWRLADPVPNKRAMRLKQSFAVPAYLAGATDSVAR
jgi:hypothetical protein